MATKEFGILLQGNIGPWTKEIVKEFVKKFPDAHILLSTWVGNDVKDIPCEVIQSDPPKPTYPHESNINFQIKGVQEGLKKINSKIVLKCKTDQIIHNRNIFNIYKEKCSPEKIMVSDLNTFDIEYRASDFCQIATKEILGEYWNEIPLYDGIHPIAPEVYLTEHYITKIKNDKGIWKDIMNNYFCIRNFHTDFQIEFEKFYSNLDKQKWFEKRSDN